MPDYRNRQDGVARSHATRRASALIGNLAGVLLALAVGATPQAAVQTDQSASILSIVPGGRVGQYRHGTYPANGNRTHVGVDIVAPCGTPVLALEDGKVIDRIASDLDPDFSSLGYLVILEHQAAIVGRVFYSLHLHLQSPPSLAATVARGEELGRVGATGHATGCHLHFEIRYFPDRVSNLWQNIYGPRDQRAARHFRENWEDPVTFIARLNRHRTVDAHYPVQTALGRSDPLRSTRN
jgi:murein DD-endopeptidase MepM/ murein hydrolase activator NlpD